MGGRGSTSGAKKAIHGGIGAAGAGGKQATFVDKTGEFAGMSLHDFENAIRSKSNEYIGVFDKGGNLVIAGTSGNSGSVAMPNIPTGYNNSDLTITHNHPSGGNRGIGGTFSPADISQLAQGGYYQIRAVTSGKGEHTYIMRSTSSSNGSGLYLDALSSMSKMKAIGTSKSIAVQQKFTSRNIKMTPAQRSAVYLGAMKNYWKPVAEQNGYEYITLKKAPW